MRRILAEFDGVLEDGRSRTDLWLSVELVGEPGGLSYEEQAHITRFVVRCSRFITASRFARGRAVVGEEPLHAPEIGTDAHASPKCQSVRAKGTLTSIERVGFALTILPKPIEGLLHQAWDTRSRGVAATPS